MRRLTTILALAGLVSIAPACDGITAPDPLIRVQTAENLNPLARSV